MPLTQGWCYRKETRRKQIIVGGKASPSRLAGVIVSNYSSYRSGRSCVSAADDGGSSHFVCRSPCKRRNGERSSRFVKFRVAVITHHATYSWAMYKLALITFNVLQHNNPMYFRDLLTTHNHSRNLRSSSQHLLSVGYMRTVSSSCCFKHSAAINWNDLAFDIRACDSVNVLNVNLRLIFSTLPLLPSHVSSPAPTINILVTYGALQVFILYCIVLMHLSDICFSYVRLHSLCTLLKFISTRNVL